MIKLFVGLGNPGAEYEDTRHNAGFWWIDALARDLNVSLVPDKGYFAKVARTQIKGQTVWLLEPQTFMNLSGKSVAALAKFFKIAPQEILVAHDELDVVPGQAKLKFGGSHAGHNGLRDIHWGFSNAEDAIEFATNWTEANKIRPIDEIVEELKLHPDYINHSIWTVDGAKIWIECEIEDLYENKSEMRIMIDQIYKMNKEIIREAIDTNFENAYVYFNVLDNIEYPHDFIELQEKCSKI